MTEKEFLKFVELKYPRLESVEEADHSGRKIASFTRMGDLRYGTMFHERGYHYDGNGNELSGFSGDLMWETLYDKKDRVIYESRYRCTNQEKPGLLMEEVVKIIESQTWYSYDKKGYYEHRREYREGSVVSDDWWRYDLDDNIIFRVSFESRFNYEGGINRHLYIERNHFDTNTQETYADERPYVSQPEEQPKEYKWVLQYVDNLRKESTRPMKAPPEPICSISSSGNATYRKKSIYPNEDGSTVVVGQLYHISCTTSELFHHVQREMLDYVIEMCEGTTLANLAGREITDISHLFCHFFNL